MGRRRLITYVKRHDIFAYDPSYEWTSYKTVLGSVLSFLAISFILFYIAITSRDYIARPPELVSQGDIDLLQIEREFPFPIPIVGIRVGYTNTSDPSANDRIAALENVNPYVRFRFRHVVVKDQQRVLETELPFKECIVSSIPSMCPIVNETQKLLGSFYKEDYKFLEILVDKCTESQNTSNCAPLSEINEKIQSGEFRIRAQLGLESQQFDVERFHTTGSGYAISNRSFEYFGLPDVELQSEIFLQARKISKEQRYLGSPPLPETEINVLSLERRETNFRPRLASETNLMTFVIRLSDNVRLEEVSYWCPSVLDLFGMWGAMASFAASLSLGFFAYQYNKWHFHRHFEHATRQKRRDAQQQTAATMNWLRNNDNCFSSPNHREEMYNNLQTQYDALMVEPDLRLFETHHFNDEGRMIMSAAEMKFPSTAFGELRRIAVMKHSKKKQAAQFLSLWYGRHLVRKGFIRNEKRRRQLFTPPPAEGHLLLAASGSSNNSDEKVETKSDRNQSGRFFFQMLRRRQGGSTEKELSSLASQTRGESRLEEMENGTGSNKTTNDCSSESSSRTIDLPSGTNDRDQADQATS